MFNIKMYFLFPGGFKKFKHEYPQFCTGSRASIDINIPKVSPNGNSQYFYEVGKILYFYMINSVGA